MEQTLGNSSGGFAGRVKNSNLAQAWLVLLLAMGFGAALAAIQINLADVIADNKLNETLEKVPELVWGPQKAAEYSADKGAMEIAPASVSVENGGKTTAYPLYRVARHGDLAGWVLKAGGQGYADKIELLLGLDSDARTITGLFILEQKETPGLGNKITFPQWRGQFLGKKTDSRLEVIKGGSSGPQTIDTVTGATISSRAVTAIVNRTIGDVKERLAADKTGS